MTDHPTSTGAGTRRVHPDEFAIPLEHLQPARKRTTAVSRLRPVAPMHSAVAPANRPAADASTLPAAHVTASPAAVRAWARANGHEVGDRGRPPAEITGAYRRAHEAVGQPDHHALTATTGVNGRRHVWPGPARAGGVRSRSRTGWPRAFLGFERVPGPSTGVDHRRASIQDVLWRGRGELPREVGILAVVAFVVALGFGIVAPAIPLFARSFGVGTTAVGLAVSAFAFFRFVSAFGGGSLVERFGERTVLSAGLAIVAVTTGLAGLAASFPLFLALRAAGGVGSAMFTVAALSLLLRVAPPSHRGRAAATWQGGFILGGIAGPAAGGLLAELSPRLPFFLYAGFLLLAGSVAMVLLRPSVTTQRSAEPAATGPDLAADPVGLRTALRSRVYLTALVANLGVGWVLFGVRNSLVPLYVTEELGRTVAWAGAGLLAGSVAQALGLLRSGRLADTWGRRPALVLGAALATISTAALVLPPALWVFLLSMAVFGLAASFLASVPAALVADVSPARGGRVVAVFQMSADLGAIVGPLVAGWLTDVVSYQAAFAVTTAVLAAGLGAALALPRTAGAPVRG